MKYLKLEILILTLCFLSCNPVNKHKASKAVADTTKQSGSAKFESPKANSSYSAKDKEEIQILIGDMLTWAESKKSFDLIPVITDSKDTLYIGFDLLKVKSNLEILRSTGYFSAEFIDNYNQILNTLDKEMKNKEFAPWSTGELPPFNFANDVDPWTDCQDVPYDTPNAYSFVEAHVVNLNQQTGELYWTWGNLPAGSDISWKKFTYKFKVIKEDGKWKISYLEGFDYKESVKVEG